MRTTKQLIAYLASYNGEAVDDTNKKVCRFCNSEGVIGYNGLTHRDNCPAVEASESYQNWEKAKFTRTLGFGIALAVLTLAGVLLLGASSFDLQFIGALFIGYLITEWVIIR